MTSKLNEALLQLTKRAEQNAPEKLVGTFVQVGSLLPLLKARDHQVMFGRRGTGKTHALTFLSEHARTQGDLAIQIDMRTVGSSTGIYPDSTVPLAERATRLILDTLSHIHDEALRHSINGGLDLAQAGPALDSLADEISQVKITGSSQRETAETQSKSRQRSAESSLSVAPTSAHLELKQGAGSKDESSAHTRRIDTGTPVFHLNFAGLAFSFKRLLEVMDGRHLWVLIDEWSSVPLDLQPLLADLVRRTLLPINGITVKIAAIEHRSRFQHHLGSGDYQGIELGADVSATLNLDDYMVFNNDPDAAKDFFSELLFKHVQAEMKGAPECPSTPEKLRQTGFTQHNAFDEFVRSSEGVPRDAINIISLAAQRANSDRISTSHVRYAATTWYRRDKEAAAGANPEAKRLLHWVIDEVIGERKARAFLLSSDTSNALIDSLFDARVIHLLKRGVSSNETPGKRFDVYGLDFGCYVDLITTTRAPRGLFSIGDDEDEQWVEVPSDDYRSIRRAVLHLPEFEAKGGVAKVPRTF